MSSTSASDQPNSFPERLMIYDTQTTYSDSPTTTPAAHKHIIQTLAVVTKFFCIGGAAVVAVNHVRDGLFTITVR